MLILFFFLVSRSWMKPQMNFQILVVNLRWKLQSHVNRQYLPLRLVLLFIIALMLISHLFKQDHKLSSNITPITLLDICFILKIYLAMTTINSADHLFTFKPLPQSPPISFFLSQPPKRPRLKAAIKVTSSAIPRSVNLSPQQQQSRRRRKKASLTPLIDKNQSRQDIRAEDIYEAVSSGKNAMVVSIYGVKGGCRWTHKGREVLKEERAHSRQWGDYHLLSLADWCGATELPLIRKNLSIFTLLCSSDASVPAICRGLVTVSKLKIKKDGPLGSKKVEHQQRLLVRVQRGKTIQWWGFWVTVPPLLAML